LPASWRFRWRTGVSASETDDGALVVESTVARLALRRMAPAVRTALMRFAPPGEDEERLAELSRTAAAGWLDSTTASNA
jgi:hypothetical protein